MTGKERVLAALGHKEADRVPIDLGSSATGIHRKAYEALLDHLGLVEEIKYTDYPLQLVRPSENVLKFLKVDTRYVQPESSLVTVPSFAHRGGKRGLMDFLGVFWARDEEDRDPLYYEIAEQPLKGMDDFELRRFPWPDPRRLNLFAGFRERALALHEEGLYAICTNLGGALFEYAEYMRGMSDFLMDMMTEPDTAEYILDKLTEFWCRYQEALLGEVGDVLDVVFIGDDLGTQRGPLIAPELYRSMVKPRQAKLIHHIKGLTQAKIWFHSCGAVNEFIPDFIDIGVDALNPVQYTADGMSTVELKRVYGDRMTFWGGGIETQHALPDGDAESVKYEVRRQVEALKPGGGYVFATVHNIQAGVPPGNILAAFEAAFTYGAYSPEKRL